MSENLFFQTSTQSADVDGDGDNDVISSSPSDGAIVWYENLGGGNFAGQQIIATDGATYSLITFDRDGDGDIEICGTKDGSVICYNYLGGGVFSTADMVVPPSSTSSIVALDVENDGDLDLVRYGGTFPWSAAIYWHENIGGNFGPEQLINNSIVSSPLTSVDVDGDGLSDLAFFNSTSMGYHRNLGGGNFSAWVPIPYTGTFGAFPTARLSTADLDADGDIDFVIQFGALDSDVVLINENLGGGLFGLEQILGKAPFLVSPVVSDVNNDGKPDIVATKSDFEVVFFENLGSLAFSTSQTLIQQDLFSTLNTGDLDGDGDQDILENSGDLNEISFIEIDGSSSPSRYQIANAVNRVEEIVHADIDGDGTLDIVSTSRRRLSWFQNLGGDFGKREIVAEKVEWHTCAASDVDGDGDMDLVAASNDLPELGMWVFENLGSGNFDAGTLISSVGRNSVFLVDIDGDGDEDIVSSSAPGDDILWNENTGGGFGSDQLIADLGALQMPEQVKAADLDNDGDQDIVIATFNEGAGWIENLGAGSFGPVIYLFPPASGGVASVEVGDINGDGLVDIASSPWAADELVWYPNLGGSFAGPVLIAGGLDEVSALKLIDFDLDGDQDLFATARSDNKVIWFENLGGGSFGAEQLINGDTEDVSTLTVADFSGDGAVDVAFGLWLRGFIGYHKNLLSPVCSVALAPDNLAVNFTAPSIDLSWDAIPLSVACQINAQRVSPPGPSIVRNFTGFEIASLSIPTGVLPPGTTWNWRIRCSCTGSAPFSATPFSTVNTFTVPAPRAVEILNTKGQVNVNWESDVLDMKSVSLLSLDGKLIDQQNCIGRQQAILHGAAGIYLLRMDVENGIPIVEKVVVY